MQLIWHCLILPVFILELYSLNDYTTAGEWEPAEVFAARSSNTGELTSAPL